MTTEILIGLVMLIVMIGAIFIGIQISFTLLFLALSFGYFALGRAVFDLAYFQTIGMMKEELLAAVPLLILMGYITEQVGRAGNLRDARPGRAADRITRLRGGSGGAGRSAHAGTADKRVNADEGETEEAAGDQQQVCGP